MTAPIRVARCDGTRWRFDPHMGGWWLHADAGRRSDLDRPAFLPDSYFEPLNASEVQR